MAPGPPKTRAAAEQRSHLAAVREGLVRRLAVAADEDLKLHAHILEAHALLVEASGADLVDGEAAERVEVLHVIVRHGDWSTWRRGEGHWSSDRQALFPRARRGAVGWGGMPPGPRVGGRRAMVRRTTARTRGQRERAEAGAGVRFELGGTAGCVVPRRLTAHEPTRTMPDLWHSTRVFWGSQLRCGSSSQA